VTSTDSPAAAGWSRSFRSPIVGASTLALGLVAYLYGPLFFPPATREFAVESEQFFFEVNEAAGAPVLILSFWLFFRRSHLRDVLYGPGEPVLGGLVFALTIALHAWGVFTGAADLQLASLIGLLFGTFLMWGGRAALRAYWMPSLFLAFALPLSPVLIAAVIWPIQLATAVYAGFVLNLIGVSSIVQGDQILRPENAFVVIETCSGLRGVVTLTMLTVLLIDLFERRGKHAVALLLLAPAVALLTNGIRVVSLVLNPHSDIASIHNLQGIAMLLVGLTGMYLIDGLIARAAPSDERDLPKPGGDFLRRPGPSSVGRMAALASPSLLLGVMLGVSAFATPWSYLVPLDRTVDAQVQEVLAEWPSEKVSPDYKFRGSIHYRSWSRRWVLVDGHRVDVLVGLANPTNRKLSTFSGRLARPDSGFAFVEESAVSLTQGAPVARRLILRRGAKRVLSYSWYEPAPSFPNEFLRHALALDRSPFARPETAVAIRLSTTLGKHREDAKAEARLIRIYERLRPILDSLRTGAERPR